MPPRPGLRGRLYACADGFGRRVTTAFRSLAQGFWLGLMDNRHLDGIGARYYERKPVWRDDAHNASGLFSWEDAAVRNFFPAAGAILVGASGGGREVAALAKRGYRVEGFECGAPLLEYSQAWLKRVGVEARIVAAEPGRVPDGLGRCDGVVVGWTAYMHIPGRSNRVAFLKRLRALVSPGAPILLSFLTRRGPSRRLTWIHRGARLLRAVRFSRDPVEYGDTLEGTFDHEFTRDEVASELKEAGFELAFWEESPSGHAVGRAVQA